MKRADVSYRMTVDVLEGFDGEQIESYGVSVSCADGERETVRCITQDPHEIDMLISLLARNRVTPVALRDIIDDWILS